MSKSAAEVDAPARDAALSTVCWTATVMLGSTLALTQPLVMFALMAAPAVLPFAAPVALLASLLIGDRLARGSGASPRARGWAAAVTLATVAASLAISAWYFDLSVDGQWYHQTAIYALADGWNPLVDPLRAFPSSLQLWVTHYAKGTWYFAASVLALGGEVELGKCQAIIAWAALALAALAAALDFGLRRRAAIALAAVAALNPVVTSALTTFLVESVLGSFLTVALAAVLAALRRPRRVVVAAACAAVLVMVNAKLTGLVFSSFLAAGGAGWCLWRRREAASAFVGGSAIVLVLATMVWGWNPYVTNTLFRGHPFYPLLGTARHPSLAAQGKQGIDRYETPKNLLPLNRVARLGYAWFGRPGNAPYIGQRNAELMWPFAARITDLRWYDFHETRVAGFGPYFGGALLLALGLAVAVAWRHPAAAGLLALLLLGVVGTLLLSVHTWWARYSPQTWFLAVLPTAFALHHAHSATLRRATWLLVGLLLVNGAIVAVVRTAWETRSSAVLRRQLAELPTDGRPVELYTAWYPVSVPERLRRRGIDFVLRDRKQMTDGTEMKSIVEGYPDFLAVRYRVPRPAAGP